MEDGKPGEAAHQNISERLLSGLIVAGAVFLVPLGVNAVSGQLDQFKTIPMLLIAGLCGALYVAARTFHARR